VRRVHRVLLLTDLHLSHPAAYPDVPPNAVDPKHHRRLTEQDRIAAVCCLMDPFNWEKELQVCVRSFCSLFFPYAGMSLYSGFWNTYGVCAGGFEGEKRGGGCGERIS
jgi:hypothetical protein